MKKLIAVILSCALAFTTFSGCTRSETPDLTDGIEETQTDAEPSHAQDNAPKESASPSTAYTETETPEFSDLSDSDLLRYVEDNVYQNLVGDLNSDQYFVENVSAVYVSEEYLEELSYNSQSNIFFGYTLAELDEQFQGTRYVFTQGEDGETVVIPLETYDDSYEKTVKNVAAGAGVILLCVTVSAVTAAGAPAISMIFAASAGMPPR